MGAVVSVILIIPALLAFVVDRIVQRKQVAILTSRSVVYQPKKSRNFETLETFKRSHRSNKQMDTLKIHISRLF